MLLLRVATPLPGIPVPPQDPLTWGSSHRGNLYRAHILARLQAAPGDHLVIVRYGPSHKFVNEWVYNGAEIDDAKVVWARDMGPAQNQELLDYFRNRHLWVIDADESQPTLTPIFLHRPD
jgi:hypothetical protein